MCFYCKQCCTGTSGVGSTLNRQILEATSSTSGGTSAVGECSNPTELRVAVGKVGRLQLQPVKQLVPPDSDYKTPGDGLLLHILFSQSLS